MGKDRSAITCKLEEGWYGPGEGRYLGFKTADMG